MTLFAASPDGDNARSMQDRKMRRELGSSPRARSNIGAGSIGGCLIKQTMAKEYFRGIAELLSATRILFCQHAPTITNEREFISHLRRWEIFWKNCGRVAALFFFRPPCWAR